MDNDQSFGSKRALVKQGKAAAKFRGHTVKKSGDIWKCTKCDAQFALIPAGKYFTIIGDALAVDCND